MTRLVWITARGLCAAALLAATFVAAPNARAQTYFTAHLTHDQETAPGGTTPLTTATGAPRPLSFGTASFVLNADQTALSWTATIYNIDITGTQTEDPNDNLTAAHIHGPAPPGQNAGVRWGFFGAPDNDTNPKDLLVVPFATGVGGTFTSVWNQPEGNGGTNLTEQIPNITAGLTYLNFHTVQFGGGEIRGQILTAIPEPGSLALLAGGLPALLFLRRRR